MEALPMSRTILRLPRLKAKTGLSSTTLWRRERSGDFPKKVELGGRAVGWYEDEVDAWLASRIRKGGTQADASSDQRAA
jgi:prophage regulatory protein